MCQPPAGLALREQLAWLEGFANQKRFTGRKTPHPAGDWQCDAWLAGYRAAAEGQPRSTTQARIPTERLKAWLVGYDLAVNLGKQASAPQRIGRDPVLGFNVRHW